MKKSEIPPKIWICCATDGDTTLEELLETPTICYQNLDGKCRLHGQPCDAVEVELKVKEEK